MKESPVFVKMFDFVAWVIPLTVKFPREQRFVVAAATQRVTLAAHEALVRAGHSPTPTIALEHLREVGTQLALARFYLRLSELGRLVKAWQRTCQVSSATATSNGSAVSGTPSS